MDFICSFIILIIIMQFLGLHPLTFILYSAFILIKMLTFAIAFIMVWYIISELRLGIKG